jgi:hypothetical protein
MNIFAKIWAWLTGWFTSEPESTPTVDEPAPKQTAPKAATAAPKSGAPTENRIKKAAQTPADYVTQAEQDLQDMVDKITANAERYELDQDAFAAAYFTDRDLFTEAAYLVDWPAVASKYSDDAIARVMGSGTNFNIRNRDDLKRIVRDAVSAESSERAPDAPKFHGMGPEGGQK